LGLAAQTAPARAITRSGGGAPGSAPQQGSPSPQPGQPASAPSGGTGAPFSPESAAEGSASAAPPAEEMGLDAWLDSERSVALKRMLADVSPKGAAPGAVAASPSRQNPNYWYNWRRDAALTMDEVATLYARTADASQKKALGKRLADYASFVRREQTAKSLAGLGEPKFNMDGSPFNDAWGRPQDDGPAEEASALAAYAETLLDAGRKDQAAKLYGDAAAGIKADLEYVAGRGTTTSFDVWEEVRALHFDTRMAQRAALLDGARLADRLGDAAGAERDRAAAEAVDAALPAYWDPSKGIVVSALGRDGGLDYKSSGLDSSVILAAIRRRPAGEGAPAPFSPTDARVLATAAALKRRFREQYAVNAAGLGVAIGRYPEDRYYGGNPWVLLTAAYAQLEYEAARAYVERGALPVEAADLSFFQDLLDDPGDRGALRAGATLGPKDVFFIKLVDALARDGDRQLARLRRHANSDGSLSEQIDKSNGAMTSAPDLTWNYAALLTALQARDALAAARLSRR